MPRANDIIVKINNIRIQKRKAAEEAAKKKKEAE